MIEYGFQRCEADNCLYVRYGSDDSVHLLLFMNDVLIIAKNLNSAEMIKRMLQLEFQMQNLGEAEVFLGLSNRSGSESKYHEAKPVVLH